MTGRCSICHNLAPLVNAARGRWSLLVCQDCEAKLTAAENINDGEKEEDKKWQENH